MDGKGCRLHVTGGEDYHWWSVRGGEGFNEGYILKMDGVVASLLWRMG